MAVVGCDNGSINSKEIDPLFRGKWEVKSVEFKGTTYTFPCLIQSIYCSSGGWEVGSTTIKLYVNGNVESNEGRIHTVGNSFYNSTGDWRGDVQVNGNDAILTLPGGEKDYCIKVSKFTWE